LRWEEESRRTLLEGTLKKQEQEKKEGCEKTRGKNQSVIIKKPISSNKGEKGGKS